MATAILIFKVDGGDPGMQSMEKQEKFGERMRDILNCGALNLAMALGYKHRIFDVMEEFDFPETSGIIAEKAGLNARYIKEWLGIMATGRIVEISSMGAGEALYYLPKEHAALLTRSSGSSNMGVYAQEIPLLTSCAMEAVGKGFVTGDGVPFSKYPDFQAFMTELSNAKHREILVNRFLPGVDHGNLVLRLERGIQVLDLGCGEGTAMNLMAEAFPETCFMGMDNFETAIKKARQDAVSLGLDNVTYCVTDAADRESCGEFKEKFDYVVAFDSIHDQTRPLEALRNIRTMLAPKGIFSMVEIDAATDHVDNMDHPLAPFLYTVSLMHCMPVGLNNRGAGLGMMWGQKKALAMLSKAGFDQVEVLSMEHDPFNIHFLCRT